MNSKDRLCFLLVTISSIGFFSFAQWISTTRIGTTFFLWCFIFYGIALLAAVLAVPVLSVVVFFKRTRPHSSFFLILAILYIPCCITGIYFGREVRMVRMAEFVKRSQPLIESIKQYDLDHAVPPETLADLVPDYLPEVPHTGMMAYPKYEYFSGDKAKEWYAGNPWVISVDTPSGGFNWDVILYFPKQNYPKHGYGGRLERVGNWAYVHE